MSKGIGALHPFMKMDTDLPKGYRYENGVFYLNGKPIAPIKRSLGGDTEGGASEGVGGMGNDGNQSNGTESESTNASGGSSGYSGDGGGFSGGGWGGDSYSGSSGSSSNGSYESPSSGSFSDFGASTPNGQTGGVDYNDGGGQYAGGQTDVSAGASNYGGYDGGGGGNFSGFGGTVDGPMGTTDYGGSGMGGGTDMGFSRDDLTSGGIIGSEGGMFGLGLTTGTDTLNDVLGYNSDNYGAFAANPQGFTNVAAGTVPNMDESAIPGYSAPQATMASAPIADYNSIVGAFKSDTMDQAIHDSALTLNSQPPSEGAMAAHGRAGMLEAAAQAIKDQESFGGRYGITHPPSKKGDNAYGAYGVMDFNIPNWTEKYTGTRMTPAQFAQNPKAQDAVFKGEFGRLADRYGPVGAAQAWFGGPGAVGLTGRIDPSNGMSIGGYGNAFADRLNDYMANGVPSRAGATGTVEGAPTPPSAPARDWVGDTAPSPYGFSSREMGSLDPAPDTFRAEAPPGDYGDFANKDFRQEAPSHAIGDTGFDVAGLYGDREYGTKNLGPDQRYDMANDYSVYDNYNTEHGRKDFSAVAAGQAPAAPAGYHAGLEDDGSIPASRSPAMDAFNNLITTHREQTGINYATNRALAANPDFDAMAARLNQEMNPQPAAPVAAMTPPAAAPPPGQPRSLFSEMPDLPPVQDVPAPPAVAQAQNQYAPQAPQPQAPQAPQQVTQAIQPTAPVAPGTPVSRGAPATGTPYVGERKDVPYAGKALELGGNALFGMVAGPFGMVNSLSGLLGGPTVGKGLAGIYNASDAHLRGPYGADTSYEPGSYAANQPAPVSQELAEEDSGVSKVTPLAFDHSMFYGSKMPYG